MVDAKTLTPAQLQCLADWLPILDAPGFSAGNWQGGDPDANGVITMPWFEYDERIADWPGACDGETLVVMGFDWMTWLGTPEGVALSSDPATIVGASSADLARLVTAIRRSDRFSEGGLAAAIDRGFVAAISRRAAALLAEG